MYINIIRPYKDFGDIIIEFDNVSIRFNKDNLNEIFEKLDEELNDGYTRDVMDEQIQELKDEIHYLQRELNIDIDGDAQEEFDFNTLE
jgi:isopropylmalate/homocitrate/citramalate synthase